MNSRVISLKKPLVTVIVATYNRGSFLERCLRSILDQDYENIECLVIDGASQDDSVAILQRMAAEDSRLRFISEPDNGEVYAVNKGLDRARGEIIAFQASDDYYLEGAFTHAVNGLLADRSIAGVSGQGIYVNEMGQYLGYGATPYKKVFLKEQIRYVLMVRYKTCFVCHGSFFGWKEKLLKVGKFDPKFSVVPDWDYYLRLTEAGYTFGYIARPLYKFTIHQGMGTRKYAKRVEIQRKVLHQRYGMRWYHELFRITFGRALSYLQNPLRTPFLKGFFREFLCFWKT